MCWYNKVFTWAIGSFKGDSMARGHTIGNFKCRRENSKFNFFMSTTATTLKIIFASLETLQYISRRVNLIKGITVQSEEEIEREVKKRLNAN